MQENVDKIENMDKYVTDYHGENILWRYYCPILN